MNEEKISIENLHKHSLLKVKTTKDFKCTICTKKQSLLNNKIHYFCFQCDLYICESCLNILLSIEQPINLHKCFLILTHHNFICDNCESHNLNSYSMYCKAHDFGVCLKCFFKFSSHKSFKHEHIIQTINHVNLICVICDEKKCDDFYQCEKCNLNICSQCDNNIASISKNLKNKYFSLYLSKKDDLFKNKDMKQIDNLDLNNKIEKLEKNIKEISNNYNDIKKKYKSKKKKADKINDENNKLKKEIEILEKANKANGNTIELTKQLDEEKKKTEKLNKDNLYNKNEIDNLKKNIKEINIKYQNIINELRIRKEENEKIFKENEQLKEKSKENIEEKSNKKILELKQNEEKIKKKMKDLEMENEIIKKSLDSFDCNIPENDLNKKYIEEKVKTEQLSKENKEMKNLIEKQNKENKEMTKKLENLTKNFKSEKKKREELEQLLNK